MNELTAAISVLSLNKRFPGKEVLKNVCFSVPRGSVYALLGSNGAGKTTTVRILTTQLLPDGGSVFVNGLDAVKHPVQVRRFISLTGQFSAVDELLTGRENLEIMGRLLHLPSPGRRAAELLSYFGLSDFSDRAVSSYSGGMKRKLDIAMSLTGSPRVLFLDEPTTGLDPQSRRNMWKMVRELKRSGVTVFLTTQYLEEAEQLADRIAILDRGSLIAEGTPSELKAYLPQGLLRFQFRDRESMETAVSLLKDYQTALLPETFSVQVFTDGQADTLALIFSRLREHSVRVRQFSADAPSLEDVFLSLIEKKEEISHEN